MTPSGSVLASETFSGNGPWQFLGSGIVDAISAQDGLISSGCGQLTIPAGYSISYAVQQAEIQQYYYIVWGCNLKLVNGDIEGIFSSSVTLGDCYHKTEEWVSTFGIGQASTSGTVRLTFRTTNGATIRFSDFFICQFNNKDDAYAFANQRMSIG